MESENFKIQQGLAMRKFTLSASEGKGFTLIELLIVIALIGILAVALLSAINPMEQIKKGRDSTRKADASEFLNAVERYYASFQCYPWDTTCNVSSITGPRLVEFVGDIFGGQDELLISRKELKIEFGKRVTTRGNSSYHKLWVVEVGGIQNVTPGQVSVCFEPESKTGRAGGLGRLLTHVPETDRVPECGTGNESLPIATCPGTYAGGNYLCANSCWICLPQ